MSQMVDPVGPAGLDVRAWLTERVHETVDHAVMKLGELLELGRDKLGREGYERWILEDLPFGLDTGKRYRAIYRAYKELPAERLALLPKPWQAMYALIRVPAEVLDEAVSDGRVGAATTVAEARALGRELRGSPPPAVAPRRTSAADVVAADLMAYDRRELSPKMLLALDDWLTG
jgi:hypothetical protein